MWPRGLKPRPRAASNHCKHRQPQTSENHEQNRLKASSNQSTSKSSAYTKHASNIRLAAKHFPKPQPAGQPVNRLQPTSQPQPTNQPSSQPIDQPTDGPAGQPVSQPISPTCQPTNQPSQPVRPTCGARALRTSDLPPSKT